MVNVVDVAEAVGSGPEAGGASCDGAAEDTAAASCLARNVAVVKPVSKSPAIRPDWEQLGNRPGGPT